MKVHRSLWPWLVGTTVLVRVVSACADGEEGGDLNPQPLPPTQGPENDRGDDKSSSGGSGTAAPPANPSAEGPPDAGDAASE